MTQPKWNWDDTAKAGYLELNPECSPRWNREPIEANGVTIVLDEDADGKLVGIEVLL